MKVGNSRRLSWNQIKNMRNSVNRNFNTFPTCSLSIYSRMPLFLLITFLVNLEQESYLGNFKAEQVKNVFIIVDHVKKKKLKKNKKKSQWLRKMITFRLRTLNIFTNSGTNMKLYPTDLFFLYIFINLYILIFGYINRNVLD